MSNTDWRSRAACRNVDAEVLHPRGADYLAEAKALCRRCPVVAECLKAALAEGDFYGWRAGMSAADRRKLARQQPPRDLSVQIVKLRLQLHWSAKAIGLRFGVDQETVRRVLKAHREQGQVA
jgi:WhiB family transcriptional regulator, redox-sensing transcriptional regulator